METPEREEPDRTASPPSQDEEPTQSDEQDLPVVDATPETPVVVESPPEEPASSPPQRDEPADEPVAAVPEPPGAPASGWLVQVGSFRNQANAVELVSQLRAADFPARLESGGGPDATLYRIRVGPLRFRI